VDAFAGIGAIAVNSVEIGGAEQEFGLHAIGDTAGDIAGRGGIGTDDYVALLDTAINDAVSRFTGDQCIRFSCK